MARLKGGLFTSTLDVSKRAPLDSREMVTRYDDLINPTVWLVGTTNNDALFNGLCVSVTEAGENMGKYFLTDRKAITEENYQAYLTAARKGEDTSSYFSMWKKLSSIEDLIELEKKLAGYVDYAMANITLRRDNDYNYKKIENTFVPKNGEVCFVDVAGYGLRTKVGDGITTFAKLPYLDDAILQNIDGLVVRGYLYQDDFYRDLAHTTLIERATGRIYIDAATSKLYTYNGVSYETQNGGNLPTATTEVAGIMKLYDQVGQNTDGTMTQKAITNELNEKFEMDVVEEDEMVVFGTDIN